MKIMDNLFLLNPGTMIVVTAVTSIELHPNGTGVVFMNNGRCFSITDDKSRELISMIKQLRDTDYD